MAPVAGREAHDDSPPVVLSPTLERFSAELEATTPPSRRRRGGRGRRQTMFVKGSHATDEENWSPGGGGGGGEAAAASTRGRPKQRHSLQPLGLREAAGSAWSCDNAPLVMMVEEEQQGKQKSTAAVPGEPEKEDAVEGPEAREAGSGQRAEPAMDQVREAEERVQMLMDEQYILVFLNELQKQEMTEMRQRFERSLADMTHRSAQQREGGRGGGGLAGQV